MTSAPPPLRLAFVSTEDASSPDSFSGIPFQLVNALRRAGAVVTPLGPVGYAPNRWERAKRSAYSLFGHSYEPSWSPHALRVYSRHFQARFTPGAFDAVLSRGTFPLADWSPGCPCYLWQDATFKLLLDDYPFFRGQPRRHIAAGHALERRALARCRLAFYTSAWAANSAAADYGFHSTKSRVVLIGANRDSRWSETTATAVIDAKTFSTLNLLFIGVDWTRKGGDRVLALVARLNALGVPVKAHLVGALPPAGTSLPSGVIAHGLLKHSDSANQARLDTLFREAHFLLLPTRADCTPLVIPEAGSYALPVIATRIGGIPEMITPLESGLLTDWNTPADLDETAQQLSALLAEPQRWRALAHAARRRHREEMNWDTHASRIVETISQDLPR